MSSTLVETVSIDYEDFNESFLTCGTCLCIYDSQQHNPKILPCSHTVCRSCLERIVEAQGTDNSFRCPICRETISIPRGGVVSLPPSFIVNQLIDLMARQRRDVIPKCAVHSSEELMFCETCDTVFCVDCTGGSHNGRGASAHTVIPFSIAIKRMSEILLYKATLCMRNLNNASDVVTSEMTRLEQAAEECVDSISHAFQDLMTMLEQRRRDILLAVRSVCEDKQKVLQEQLDIIEAEKAHVNTDCQGLQQQVEVRNITKKISDLNEKLDVSTTLAEPRENAFMHFEFEHNRAMDDLHNALDSFGQVRVSTTFPALCTARLDRAVTHLKTVVTVTTVDYHGNPRTSGKDPLTAELRNEAGNMIDVVVKDHKNGTYSIHFTPQEPGKHKLSVNIFERPIRNSPFKVEVSHHNNPTLRVGQRGSGLHDFVQPVIAAIHDQELYVLDTGNSRVKVLNLDGHFVRHLGPHGLDQHSGTGMALGPQGNSLVVVNWRTRHVTEMDTGQGDIIRKFSCPEFVEPISVAVNSRREIIVADNGAAKLFVFDGEGKLLRSMGSRGDRQGQFKLMSCVYVGPADEIYVLDSRIQVFSREGAFLHEIKSDDPRSRGQYGGITIDSRGHILASRTEKGRSVVQVFSGSRQFLFDVDSADDRLKRPSGLATTEDGFVFVVDLGNDCVKKFRYM
ncbi:hypothetical protein CAPTEDRAFT_185576 [Capitella teleta]|uniref:RING-type domain-containing protein n=1 Tax=Capitella teleta TaxID=283909 RepID=R7V8F5_CAPTE|nr:hypothetical protein CAPTEDRAFT_185576 [Capitella teleta]|eukprot:ELU12631.1 hypothetical protein CAPTEDRAFT_185576 [Capitella teleta]